MNARKCKICGKEFYPTLEWVYKKNDVYYCSYTCYRKVTANKRKREIVIPKVGDTIRTIRVAGVPSYANRVGVVEFFDCWGQLHGTWGEWVVIPGEDRYEIIGESKEDGNDQK